MHAKVQGQRSVGSKDRVETNGRTDGRTEAIALPATLMRSIKIYEYKDVACTFCLECPGYIYISLEWHYCEDITKHTSRRHRTSRCQASPTHRCPLPTTHIDTPLLPDRHFIHYSLRERSYNRTLLNSSTSTHLSNDDFLIRNLY